MDDKTINLSSRTIIWLIASAALIVFLLFFLNDYDNKRKFNQFKYLNELIVNSDYPERFIGLVEDFRYQDTNKIKIIKENLGLLNRDYKKIHYSMILINIDSVFYKITSTQIYSKKNLISKEKYLSKCTNKYISILDSGKQTDLRKLFELTSDGSNIETIIQLTENSYLVVRQYRR